MDSPYDQLRVSVLIPAFNEKATLSAVVCRVHATPTPVEKEIIVVDDGSTDGTREIAYHLRNQGLIDSLIVHKRNLGKGAALRTAFDVATGEILLIQDADLEYDPQDYPKLIEPLLSGDADVVYGSRFLRRDQRRVSGFWQGQANRVLTLLSNLTTNLKLTDMETGYKVFRADVAKQFDLKENGFGVEPEITAKIARLGCHVCEVGISYEARSYKEGKKIGLKDALRGLYCILYYGGILRYESLTRW